MEEILSHSMQRVHQWFGIGQTESIFKNYSDKEARLISFRMKPQESVEITAAPRKCLILSPSWAERNLAERGDSPPALRPMSLEMKELPLSGCRYGF